MKKFFTIIIFIVILITLIIFPSQMTNGVKEGLILWSNAIIPALFPYMFISNLIINSTLLTSFSPVVYIIMSGLFFGYPSCSISACSISVKGIIKKEKAEFLTCSFNNISPAFISGYFCIGILDRPDLIPTVFIIFYINILLSTNLIYLLFYKNINLNLNFSEQSSTLKKGILDEAIISAFSNLLKIGGYVIIFSIIKNFMQSLPFSFIPIICGIAEITSGISIISKSYSDLKLIIMICLPLLSFGGLSGIFQTFSVDSNHILSKKKYIYSKILSCVTCALITYPAVYVFNLFE